jgi:exonuclease V gamma subunit
VEHLVLCSIAPDGYPKSSRLACRKPKFSGMKIHQLSEVAEAETILADLLELYEIGQDEPLLLCPRTSSAYLQQLDNAGEDSAEATAAALQGARRVWQEKSGEIGPECETSVFRLLFRDADPLDASYPGEFGLQGEENSFETLVKKIFTPLQDHLGGDE